jgi:predicted aldo/keto reductase-like oxidoreductase
MSRKDANLNRRDFLKTVGLAGIAVAGAGVPALAAPEPKAPAKAPTMSKRTLGKTGVDVPILALGGMFDTLNNQLLLRQARKWGVTYWDTAESYGNGLSETGFGRYFSRHPEARREIFLVTKLVPKEGNLTQRLEQSLKRLKTDYVDLFFIHSITGIDDMTPAFRDWGAEMKKVGKIKFFGFSTHTNMADCLAGAARLNWIDALMLTYNFQVMDTPKMVEAVSACAKAGIGLVAMKTQAGSPGPKRTASQAMKKVVRGFLDKGFTDKQANLMVVWDSPQIASLCSQMPNLTILSANVAAARGQTKLAWEERELFRQYARESRSEYCAGCGHICQSAVGGAVAINEVMRCLMYHRDYGEPDLAREVFAELPGEMRQQLTRVDYSPAERACPQGLAITELMHQAEELLA